MTGPAAARITGRGLTITAGGRALLDGVDVDCPAGAVVVVVGENGAGKSTLLDALCGLRALDAGAARLGDIDVRALPPRARAQRIASLSQGDPTSFALSAEARIGQGMTPRRGPHALLDDAARARVRAVADELAVAHHLERDVASLSTGERRRVQLARALVDDAEAYVLDEPHAGVDVKHQALVNAALRARARAGAIVVASVHDLATALVLGDRVVGLRGGKKVIDGPPREALSPAGIEAIYGVAGARIVDEDGVVGVLLPRR